jgi:hypothetical protein
VDEEESEEESEDVLSSSKKSYMMKDKGKGKGKTRADGKLPFKALPTPVKSSQTIAKGDSSFGRSSALKLLLEIYL